MPSITYDRDRVLFLEILSCEELATTLSLTTETLAVWRAEGKGPAYVKAGRSVFYRIEDIRLWLMNSYPSTPPSSSESETPPPMKQSPPSPLPPMQEQGTHFPEPVGVLQ